MKKIKVTEIRNAYKEMEAFKQRYYTTKSNDYSKVMEANKHFNNAAEKLTSAITEAEGRARVRLLNARDICKALDIVENKIGSITKKSMEGIHICVDVNAQNFPNCYKGSPESTIFCAEYRKGHWYITDIHRGYTARKNHGYTIHLTEEAKAAILDKIREF